MNWITVHLRKNMDDVTDLRAPKGLVPRRVWSVLLQENDDMMKIGRASFFAGAAIFLLGLTGCPSTSPPPPGFAISVFTKPLNPGFFELHVNGTNFTPGGSVTVSYANIPNRPGSTPGSGPFPLVQSDGTIMYAEAMHCTSNDPRDASGSVFVNMKDLASGNFASANTPATPWVCPL